MNTDSKRQETSRTSLEDKFQNLVFQLENILNSSQVLNPGPIQKLISDLQQQVKDVSAIEKTMNSIRNEIISPVKSEFERSAKLGKYSKWGFWVGLVGGILAIVSIFLYIIDRNVVPDLKKQIALIKDQNREAIKLLNGIPELKKQVDHLDDQLKQSSKTPSIDYTPGSLKLFSNPFSSRDTVPNFIGTLFYNHSETIKVGDTYKDPTGSISFFFEEVFQDNTATVNIVIPYPPISYGITGSDNSRQLTGKVEGVKPGKEWSYRSGNLGLYNTLTVRQINYQEKTCSIEINQLR